MELVTGFAGTAHIDPVDFAHLNAAAFGPDAYLLDTQNKLEASLETANKLVIDTGDLMIQGHHFTVVESEEVALQSGVSGQKRNALVCARYDKAEGTGVESASWVVKYGTSTTDTPTDPIVTTGNILDGVDSVHEEPIFRIEYDGITPGNPILLVPEFQSASEFRTSIDHAFVLYESEQGTKGAITLSDSAANYDYLEFFWKHDDGVCGSQRIASPNGKTIGINATSSTSYGYLWFAFKALNISGTQCTLNTDHAVGELGFTNDGTMERRKQDKLAITKVVGYKLS